MSHGKIMCVCGRLIAQCRCIEGHKNVTVHSPCTHLEDRLGAVVQVPVPIHPPGNLFERPKPMFSDHTHYTQHKLEPPRHAARHIINDGIDDYETSDGLAFTIGVCIIEAETRKNILTVFSVMHPNRVALYTVWYDSDTQTVTVKPVVA